MNVTISNLHPTQGYLLVQPADSEKQTRSGIYLPDSHDEKPQYGTVLAVGADGIAENGTPLKASAKKGDTVIYKKWGGNDVKIGDKEYQFLKFDDVLAVVSSK
jgi:chaperonin GroES